MNSLTLFTVRNYVAASLFLLLFALNGYGQTTWDFETADLRGWSRTGTAFDNQPTYQDNVLPRQPSIAVNHQGDYWIGTFENRPNAGTALGTTQGDAPQGTLTSEVFVVAGNQISLLLGGGRDLALVRVELLIRSTDVNRSRFENVLESDGTLFSYQHVTLSDGEYYQIHANSGRNAERMERINWPVRELRGEQARIRIVDESSGSWGHINVDDIRLDRSESPTAGAPGDVRVTGMEVTQVIQTFPGNGIPLIANKPTMVRVYVASREDSRGRWEDISANLTVRRGRGGPQIGSILRPATGYTPGTITVSPGGSERRRFDDSLNFLLYPEQTTEGEIELEVQTFSVSRRPESDTDNNRLTGQFAFRTNPGFTFYCLSYGYSAAPYTTAAPFSDFEPHRAWSQSALPVANLWALPYPGYPRGNVAHLMVRNPDGTIRDDGYLEGRAWAHQMIDRLEPRGKEWVVVMQPEEDPSYHGAHQGSGAGNHVINMMSNYSDPGPTLAHEFGHGWGQPHTWENSSFPHPGGGMGNQVGVRLFRLGAEIRNDPGNHDIMSYEHPQWLSPYTYTEILRRMTEDRLRVPPAVRDARWQAEPDLFDRRRLEPQFINAFYRPTSFTSQSKDLRNSQEYLYVAGWILPDGTATFLPFEKITVSEQIGAQQPGSTYRLSLEDSAGKLLGVRSFDKPLVADDPGNNRFLFSMYVPMDQATSRITLRDKTGKVLTERKVSPNSPQLRKLVCKCEHPLTGRRVVSWEGSDEDGDSLTYSVWYSTDGGERWIPLQIGLTETSFEFDFDTLPGSDEAMFRVLASDGVNTTEVRSEQPIRVPNKSPQVTIASMETLQAKNSSRIAAARLVIKEVFVSETQPLLLIGSAIDYEDGPITNNAAFQWSSDKDDELGSGAWVMLSKLSRGKHRITLTVKDSNGVAGRNFIEIIVQDSK